MSDHAEQSHAPMPPANAGDVRTPNAGHTAAHDEIAHGHEAHTAQPQEEQLPISKVVTVGIVSLLIFAIGSVWALKMRTAIIHEQNPTGASNIPSSMGAEEQGIVDQIPFDLNHWVKDDRAASAAQLHNYGWVDQKAGTLHIPIERAMELQLSGQPAPVIQPSDVAQSPDVAPAPAPVAPAPVSPAPQPTEQK